MRLADQPGENVGQMYSKYAPLETVCFTHGHVTPRTSGMTASDASSKSCVCRQELSTYIQDCPPCSMIGSTFSVLLLTDPVCLKPRGRTLHRTIILKEAS